MRKWRAPARLHLSPGTAWDSRCCYGFEPLGISLLLKEHKIHLQAPGSTQYTPDTEYKLHSCSSPTHIWPFQPPCQESSYWQHRPHPATDPTGATFPLLQSLRLTQYPSVTLLPKLSHWNPTKNQKTKAGPLCKTKETKHGEWSWVGSCTGENGYQRHYCFLCFVFFGTGPCAFKAGGDTTELNSRPTKDIIGTSRKMRSFKNVTFLCLITALWLPTKVSLFLGKTC